MPKYYVKSGDVSMIVSAMDAEGAALWAIHRNSDLPEMADAATGDLQDLDWQDMLPEWAPDEFDAEINISQRGFSRSEEGKFATAEAMKKYGQLLVAVERLLGR